MKLKSLFTSDGFFSWMILIILILSGGGHIVQGDEETMFRITQNLVSGDGLAVGREKIVFPALDAPFIPNFDEIVLTTSGVQGVNGQYYSKYGVGQSLAAIPLFLLGRVIEILIPGMIIKFPAGWIPRLVVSMLNPIALAGCVWLVAKFGTELGYSNRTSRWIAIAAVFSTFNWAYVKTFYSQPGVGFLLLSAMFSAYRWKLTVNHTWLWWFSLACGVLVLFRISTVIAIPPLILYLIMISPRSQRWDWIFPLSTSMLIALGITGAYNLIRFNSVFAFGYSEISWTTPIVYGLYGLLFSPGKGVFIYAPILIICLLAGILFYKEFRWEAVLIGSLWLVYLGFYAPHNYWTGGFNWGPRFMVPLISLSCLPLGYLLENRKINWGRWVFLSLFVLGLFIQLPAIIVDHSRYLVQHFTEKDSSQAYRETIQDISFSPVLNQWEASYQVLRYFSLPGAKEQVRKILESFECVDSRAVNGKALLVSNFLRWNTPDFWWFHLAIL